MSRPPQTYIAHSVSLWGMMGRIVELMNSFMKGQGIYTKFKEKYNKKETLRSLIPQEEENSTLMVDS
jgi:hypothetical protein